MSKLALYMHAGSGNHGCEAIVDSLVRLLPEEEFILLTNSAAEDEKYLPEELKKRITIAEEQHIDRSFFTHALYYAYRKVTGDRESFLRYRYAPVTGKDRPELAISIGGDNYCYPSMVEDLRLANRMFNRQGTKTVLLGCSIEPELLKEPAFVEDMNRYYRIIARESITCNALLDAGIAPEKVYLCPDPAFALPSDESALPEEMETGNAVGINLSPMAGDYAKDADAVFEAYRQLIRHILDNTNMQAALIPHVVWERSNDRAVLERLKACFPEEKRVFMVSDMPAEKLKGVIANCRFFVGARTHATIAAYSTLVPTLVIGYSVKARAIARDLFGSEEHYILPVQDLTDPQQMVDAFTWIYTHEDEIRYDLTAAAPMYIRQSAGCAEELRRILKQIRNG